jgi:L,D-transpeptidase catalytic domain
LAIWLHFCLYTGNWGEGDAMTALKLSRIAMATVGALVLATQALARCTPNQSAQQGPQQQVPVGGVVKRVIVVSLEDRKLALVEGGKVKKIYTVAVGKPSTPSPVGTLTIERRVVHPTYQHDGKTIPPGPRNPIGTRWIGLSRHGYGIHGTNDPKSIGKAASHGCIRMGNADLEEFYELVAEGDTVELVGKRNDKTAQLFGNGQDSAASATAQVAHIGAQAQAQNANSNAGAAAPEVMAMVASQ